MESSVGHEFLLPARTTPFLYWSFVLLLLWSGPSFSQAQQAQARPLTPSHSSRGLWVWKTKRILKDKDEQQQLLEECEKAGITEIYLYLYFSDYKKLEKPLKSLITRLTSLHIKVFGLEGDRGYLSDSKGPALLFSAAENLIKFNESAKPSERFAGFQTDLEIHDSKDADYKKTFHNDLANSALDSRAKGVWKKSQAEDREMLLRDYLATHAKLKTMLSQKGLSLAAVVPGWFDSYHGEELAVTFKGVNKSLTKHLMDVVDHYQIMSYNTNPDVSAKLSSGEINFAESLPPSKRPRVWLGIETHSGPGPNVSYGDNELKNSKEAVLQDLQKLERLMTDKKSFQGVNIHDWDGWKALPEKSGPQVKKAVKKASFFLNFKFPWPKFKWPPCS